MKKYIKIALISLFVYMCFKSVWIAFLTDIVPREYTYFFSYEQFCKKADDFVFEEELPASAGHLKYYWYNGWFNKFRGVKMTLSEEDFEKEKEYFIEWFSSRNVNSVGIEKYQYDATDIKYVDEHELEEKGLYFIKSMIDLNEYTYYYVVIEDNYTNKRDDKDIDVGEGVLANDETRELLVYSYQLVHDSETEESGPTHEE